jgi:hypothetical protein
MFKMYWRKLRRFFNEFIDSSEETETYSYIFERAELNKLVLNDSVSLVYFNIPYNVLLLKDKKKCFV